MGAIPNYLEGRGPNLRSRKSDQHYKVCHRILKVIDAAHKFCNIAMKLVSKRFEFFATITRFYD